MARARRAPVDAMTRHLAAMATACEEFYLHHWRSRAAQLCVERWWTEADCLPGPAPDRDVWAEPNATFDVWVFTKGRVARSLLEVKVRGSWPHQQAGSLIGPFVQRLYEVAIGTAQASGSSSHAAVLVANGECLGRWLIGRADALVMTR